MTSRRGTAVTRDTARSGRSGSVADLGELAHPTEIAPGVTVTWDPAHPHRCVDLSVPDDRHGHTADVDTFTWLRLTAVAVLDRQLYLPLDRSLLDAEHASAQLAAARTLGAADPLRDALVRRALVGARAASDGVAACLERLAADRRPALVTAALDRLVRCYASLSGEVRGFDDALASVVDAGRRLAPTTGDAGPQRDATVVAPVPAAPAPHGVDRIDPRSIPARVLQLGPDCDAAEIGVTPVARDATAAVRVRVDAYSPVPRADRPVDVGVRLVERRSGSVCGHGLLGRPVTADRTASRYFEGTVPLPPSLAASDVRVDLFGVTADPPPAPADDGTLRRARRATLFLAGWRALVADVRLWGVRVAPAARLREIAGRITGDDPHRSDAPLWAGGPSYPDLGRLGELGDRALTSWLLGGRVPAASEGTVVGTVSGPGDLLIAEIVAAHERSRG